MSDKITVAPLFADEDSPAETAVGADHAPGPAASVSIPIPSEDDVNGLGADSRHTYDDITAKLLQLHKASDLGAMGAKLNEVIGVAKGLDYQKGKKSLVESALGFLRNERERILAHVQTVQGRLDGLNSEIDAMVAAEREHIKTLRQLQTANRDYHDAMSAAANQGEAWLAAINIALVAPAAISDAFAAAQQAEVRQRGARLERAINDFKNAMALAQQEALTIQMELNNTQALLDEFDRTKTLVLPALRSIVGQQLIQIDQKHAAETDALLRSTLDEALRTQAQLTGDNSVQVAKLQQSSVINTKTLLECETILDQAAAKVVEIQEAGRQARLADATNRTEIERRLLSRLTN